MPPHDRRNAAHQEVLALWFSARVRPLWFRSTPEFDAELRARFLGLHAAAAAGALKSWEQSPEGAVALVIVLDQLPLNMFRGRPEAFATEAAARAVAGRAIDLGLDAALPDEHKLFLYMPYMHSEDPADQDRSVALFERAGLKDTLKWARHHREIVHRFGRFPHRNAIVGRTSTPQELVWLASKQAFHG